DSGKGVIFLTDDPEQAAKKIMSAATDDKAAITYDRENQPGISNLLQILALLRDQPIEQVIETFSGQSSYGEFKSTVADEIRTFLGNFQQRLEQVSDDAIQRKLHDSEVAMNQQANETLLRVQKAVGLR